MLIAKLNLARVRDVLQGIRLGQVTPVVAATLIVANLTPSVENAGGAFFFERNVSWINQLLTAEPIDSPELLLERLTALSSVSLAIKGELDGLIGRLFSVLSAETQASEIAA